MNTATTTTTEAARANARIRTMVRKDDEHRVSCPECGCNGPHGDNGGSGEYRRLRCACCGTRFAPATEMTRAA